MKKLTHESLNAWDHLPNAKHIDQVLSDLKTNPEVFDRAWYAAWNVIYDAAKDGALSAADVAALDAARHATKDAIVDAAWAAVYDAARPTGISRRAARDAILAFIAYDDSGKYLNTPYEKLKTWAELSEDPAAILLVPYLFIKKELVCQSNLKLKCTDVVWMCCGKKHWITENSKDMGRLSIQIRYLVRQLSLLTKVGPEKQSK